MLAEERLFTASLESVQNNLINKGEPIAAARYGGLGSVIDMNWSCAVSI
jgi:hypothetical protein